MDGREQEVERLTLQKLKQSDRINVMLRNMFIFLTRDGMKPTSVRFCILNSIPDTVISFRRTRDLSFTKGISLRLRQAETNLRANADSSMLVHALLDLSQSSFLFF
jgi:hypothetical protein